LCLCRAEDQIASLLCAAESIMAVDEMHSFMVSPLFWDLWTAYCTENFQASLQPKKWIQWKHTQWRLEYQTSNTTIFFELWHNQYKGVIRKTMRSQMSKEVQCLYLLGRLKGTGQHLMHRFFYSGQRES
jgi:hypothetical protein